MAYEDDEHRKPKAGDWGVLNAIPEPPPMEIEPPRREVRRSEPPLGYDPLLPSPDALVDVPIKKHRSYAGLVFLLVIAAGAAGLYFVMRTDIDSNRVRGNPDGIKLGGSQTITQAGAAGEEIEVAPPPAKTLLRVESDPPGARVVVNGNAAGDVTPTAVQTFVGQPAEVFVFAEGQAPARKMVTVGEQGGPVSVALEAATGETGALEVTSDPPGAFVEYMGVIVGETPFRIEKVPAGSPAFFRLKKEGHYAHTVRYELAAGEERRVGVKLIPDDGKRTMATVFVESLPFGARVERFEGEAAKREGVTGNRPVEVFARIGYPLTLQLSADRFGTEKVQLDVSDATYTVMLRLPPPKEAFGALSLSGPKGLTVYLDGEEQDALPLRKVKVRAGERNLVVVDPETRARATLKLKVGEEEEVSRSIKRTDDGRIVVE